MDTFVPERKQVKIMFEVMAKEVHLLKELRKVNFGQITVHKANGTLIRIESVDSVLLSEEEGLKVD